MKTCIVVPYNDKITPQFFGAIKHMFLARPEVMLIEARGTYIHQNRNIGAKMAVDNGFERIVWVDSDIAFSLKAFKTLERLGDSNPEAIISVMYPSSGIPSNEIWGRPKEPVTTGYGVLHTMESANYISGFGFTLTPISCFMEHKQPWFGHVSEKDPTKGCGEDYFFFWHQVNTYGTKAYTVALDGVAHRYTGHRMVSPDYEILDVELY